jgi:hypothetical protein
MITGHLDVEAATGRDQVPTGWWLVRRDDGAIEVWQRGETTSDDPAFSIPLNTIHAASVRGAAIGSSSTNCQAPSGEASLAATKKRPLRSLHLCWKVPPIPGFAAAQQDYSPSPYFRKPALRG